MLGANSPKIIYGFATGRVKVLETRMVSRERISRLIEAETFEEIRRVLIETDYGSELRDADTVDEIESALQRKLKTAYQLLRESDLPPEMSRYWQSRHDITNLRLILKSGFGRQVDVKLSGLGEVSAATLEAMTGNRSFAGLPEYLEAAARDAVDIYLKTESFEALDAAVDRHFFANRLWSAKRMKSKWIIAYTRMIIDLANGRVIWRARQEAVGGKDISDYLLAGGNVKKNVWIKLLSLPEPTVYDFNGMPDSCLKRLAAWLAKGAPVGEYDLMADATAVDYLESARRYAAGPEPVFAYIAAYEHEIKLLRLVIFGRLSGLRPERLKERVSSVYE